MNFARCREGRCICLNVAFASKLRATFHRCRCRSVVDPASLIHGQDPWINTLGIHLATERVAIAVVVLQHIVFAMIVCKHMSFSLAAKCGPTLCQQPGCEKQKQCCISTIGQRLASVHVRNTRVSTDKKSRVSKIRSFVSSTMVRRSRNNISFFRPTLQYTW